MNWNSKEFIWLDWTILIVGIIAVIWAVWRAVQKDKRMQQGESSEDYLFGKGEPWYIIGAAIFAANIGSEHLVGLAGTGAKSGVGMAHWEMQGWMILLLGWLFVPFYQLLNNKMGKIITMPDFLKYRYTQRTGSWLSIITLIAYILTKVSVTAYTGGIFLEFLLGLPFWYGAIGLIVLTGIFTVLGGMKGVMTLSAIQTPILIIGSFLVLFLGLAALGGGSISTGWTEMMEHARSAMNVGADGHAYGANHMFHWTESDPMYQDYPGFWVFIGASIIGFWYWCTDQHIVQRVLGQRKGEANDVVMKRARRGSIAAGYFKILPVFMFLIPGMVAAALAAKGEFDMSNTDAAFAVMVKDVLPAGVKGIVTIGFICALVASLAAFFNSCATLFTEDFYKPMCKGKSESTYVMVGRIATVVVVILGNQIVDVLGVHAEHIFVGVEVKQIHAAVIFLKLPDHAPDQPFPVSAAAGQSQPAEFFCPKPIADFQQKGDCIGVVGNEKEWRDLLRLHPDFEGRTRVRYLGQDFPFVLRPVSVLAKVFHSVLFCSVTFLILLSITGFNVDEAHIHGADFALCVIAEVDGIVTVTPARGEDGQVAVRVRHGPVEPVAAVPLIFGVGLGVFLQ